LNDNQTVLKDYLPPGSYQALKTYAQVADAMINQPIVNALAYLGISQNQWKAYIAFGQNMMISINNHQKLIKPLLDFFGITEIQAVQLLNQLANLLGNQNVRATEVFQLLNINISSFENLIQRYKSIFDDPSITIYQALSQLGYPAEAIYALVNDLYKIEVDPQMISFQSLYEFIMHYYTFGREIALFMIPLVKNFGLSIVQSVSHLIPTISISSKLETVFKDIANAVITVTNNLQTDQDFLSDVKNFFTSIGTEFPMNNFIKVLQTINGYASQFISQGFDIFELFHVPQETLNVLRAGWKLISKLIEGKISLIALLEVEPDPNQSVGLKKLFDAIREILSLIEKDSQVKDIVAAFWKLFNEISNDCKIPVEEIKRLYDQYVPAVLGVLSGAAPLATFVRPDYLEIGLNYTRQIMSMSGMKIHDFICTFIDESEYDDMINMILSYSDIDNLSAFRILSMYLPYNISMIVDTVHQFHDHITALFNFFIENYPESHIIPICQKIVQILGQVITYFDLYLQSTFKDILLMNNLDFVYQKIQGVRMMLQNPNVLLKDILDNLFPITFLDIYATLDKIIQLNPYFTLRDLWNCISYQDSIPMMKKKNLREGEYNESSGDEQNPVHFTDLIPAELIMGYVNVMRNDVENGTFVLSHMVKDAFSVDLSPEFFEEVNVILKEMDPEATDLTIKTVLEKFNISEAQIQRITTRISNIMDNGVVGADSLDSIVIAVADLPDPTPTPTPTPVPTSAPVQPTAVGPSSGPYGIATEVTTGSAKKSSNTGLIVGAVFASLGAVALIVVVIVIITRKKKDSYSEYDDNEVHLI